MGVMCFHLKRYKLFILANLSFLSCPTAMEHNTNNIIEDDEVQIGAIEVEVDPNQPVKARRNKNEDPQRKEKREKWNKKHGGGAKRRDGNTAGVLDKLEALNIPQEVVRIKNDGVVWRDPHYEYCEKKIEVTEDQIEEEFGERAWQDVDWDAAREESAKRILENSTQIILPQDIQGNYII
jgi:hypothetical protein